MRRIYPPSWRVFALLILCFDLSLAGKKGSYSVPLIRTKRDLRDSRGNPTENLKGRPGQGYYITTDLGIPAQRVSTVLMYSERFKLMFTAVSLRLRCLTFCNLFMLFLRSLWLFFDFFTQYALFCNHLYRFHTELTEVLFEEWYAFRGSCWQRLPFRHLLQFALSYSRFILQSLKQISLGCI